MVAAALLGGGVVSTPKAQAANLYWDIDPATAGTGGTGSWTNDTSANWSVTAVGDTAAGAGTFGAGDVAYFTGTAGTVTLGGPVTIGGLVFSEADFTVTGATLTLAAASGAPGIYVTNSNVVTLASVLAGVNGLTKTGNGLLRLTNGANTYAGTTTIEGGSVLISAASQLGTDTSAVVVTAGNGVPSNTALIGFTGGSLILDGSLAGFEFSRPLNLEGRGPIGNNGAALLSIGNNTLSGLVTASASPQTPATFRNTRLTSSNGILTLSGGLVVQGTAGTTFTTLGGVNQGGVANYDLTGTLTGTGTLQKVGGGTLFISPSAAAGFAGRVRVSASAANGQSSVRVFSTDAFGTANAGTTSATIDMDGGVLEAYADAGLNFAKNVYARASSSFFVSNAIGGFAVNGTTSYGNLSYEDNITLTFAARNGHGMSFTTAPVNGGDNNTTITNNMAGRLSFSGAFWSNADTGAARTLLFNGNGATTIGGGIIATGGAPFDHVLTKNGTGLLSITGINSTLDGAVNSHGGAIAITDFRSLNNSSTAAINIGSGTTGSGLIIGTGVAATAAGLTTSRTINLSGTTGAASIYADQSVSSPVILNANLTATGTGAKTLTLGGVNAADNVINGIIPNNSGTHTTALTKVGAGTWVLAGANTYTGLTSIVNGTLKIKANAATSTVLPVANDITFGNSNVYAGGTLEFVGQPGVSNVQTLDVLTTTSGAATIRLTPGAGGTASLVFSSQSTGSAGTANFVGGDFVSNKITITGGNGLVSRTNYWNGADFAYREANVLRAPVYGTDSGFVTSGSALTSGANMEMTGSFATNTISVSTLKVAGSHTLTLNAAQTLTLSNGGVLVTEGDAVITGGTALALGSQALVVRANLAADTLSIESVITGSGGLTKGGAGTLILAAANAQTGTISINEGTVRLSGSGRLGAANAALTMRQGTVLDLNGVTPSTNTDAFNSNGSVTSAVPATFTVGANNGTGSSFGTVDGAVSLTKLGTGAQSWLGASTYTGVTTIGSTGLVTVDLLADIGQNSGVGRGDATSDATNAASLVFNGSTGGISYRGDFMVGQLTLGSFSASTDRLFTLAGTGATLASSQTTNINNAVVWRNTGAIAHGIVGPQTVIFTGSSQGDNRFNPQLTDSGTGANITSFTKTGTGIWHLGGSANTYSGATVITQGILGATNGQGLSPNSNLQFDGGTLYSQGLFNRNIGTGAGEMRFLAAAANTAQFSGGFLGGDSKLTVTWTGTPVWGSTAGFIDARDGFILNGSQARAQGATGSIALSEVEIAGNFSLGTASATGKTIAVTTADNSATGTVTTGDTSGLVVGQSITGANISSGAYITSINSSTQFTMSANASTATATNRDLIANNLRGIRVDDNGNTGADFATISGVISAGDAATGLRKLGSGTLRLTGLNTYQGETNVNQGALVVRSLGSNLSAASTPTSVGLSGSDITFGNANALTIGNGGSGGAILQYVGPGETTDRKVRINTTTGGAQLHADGSGAWVLTNFANDMAAGAKTLNLRGTNAGANLITSQLSDNGGALAVTVDGGAAWVLTNGTNNYTGLTLVSAGALGIGHNTAIGGAIQNSNGNIFAYGADRSVANVLTLNNNAQWGFTGNYSLAFTSPVVLATSANSNNVYNSVVAGKALTFASMTANALNANRNFGVDGPGETIIAGNITTSTAFGLQIIKTGDGTLTLGGDGAVSNWNQTGTGLDLDRGVLKFIANNVINTSAAAFAGITVTPELADGDVATIDLNGTTQTVNGLTASTNGTLRVDNASATPGSFRFGANNAAVAFGTGVGTYVIQNTGAGALGLVKLGNTAVTFGSGVVVGNKGELASEGGSFTVAGQVTAASGLRAIGASTLSLTGGLTNPGLMRAIEVGAGSTLTLLDGAGSNFTGLTALRLGNTGTGTATLNLNVGTGVTDTLKLTTGGTLALGATVTFNLTDAGLDENTTYTLLELVDGGITAFGASKMVQGAMPGGFASISWLVDDNRVQVTTGTLITGTLYWRGLTSTAWNGNVNNWSTDKAGATAATSFPGAGTDVIFSHDGASGALTTTLEQNYRLNSLTFEPGTTTPSSVTINAGTNASSRLEVSDFITLAAGAPATVTLGTAYKIGGAQTWTVADAATTLTIGGALLGGADVIKAGAGKVVLAAAADATFNAAQTFDLTINAGNFEIQNTGSLGTLANSNLATVAINGGSFYYANATGGTVPTPLTLNGGSLSAGLANHTYSGAVAITSASTINMAEANGPAANAARNITLSGVVSGSGTLTIDSNNTASGGNQLGGTFAISNAASTWSGNLIFNRGTVSIEAAASPGVQPGDITFNSFGRYIVKGVDGQTINRAGVLTLAASAIGEFQVDNTTGTQVTDFVVNQNGAVSLGAGSGLRVALSDQLARLNLAGPVTMAGDASISVSNAATRILTVSGVISETGGARSLTINDDLGGWGATNGIVRLTAANTFTGGLTVADGVVEFATVSNIGGLASNLGQGSAFSLAAGTLRFTGDASQTTNRTIATTGNATLSANGTAGASVTFAGAVTQALDNSFTLVGATGAEGFLTGGITQTGVASDLYVNSGVWTLSGAASVIADDIVVTGSTAVLSLGSASLVSFTTGTSNGLYARSGAVINLLASDVFGPLNSGSLDFILLGDNVAGIGALNLNAFNLETPRLDLGQRAVGYEGQVDGTGTLLVKGGAIDLFRGTINANLASDGSADLEKYSLGTVTFRGDNAGLAATGATVLFAGALVLDYSANTATKLRAGSALDMRGGALTLNGNASADVVQTVASFTLANGGSNLITLTPSVANGLALNLNALTRAVNAQDGTLRIVLPAGVQSAANGVTTDTTNGLGSGAAAILGGWLTVDAGNGVFFARNSTNAADGNIVAAVTTERDDVSTWVAGENISDATGYVGTLTTAGPLSLRFDAAAGSDLVLASVGALGIVSGGVLVTANVGGSPSITNGTLFSGALASNVPELIFTQDSAQVFEVSADILVNHSLTKTGNGVLLLSGRNRYSGSTEVQNGVLRLVGGNAVGDASLVTLSNSRATTLQLLASETIGRLGGGSRQTDQDQGLVDIGVHTLTFNQTSGTTYSGMIAGSGSIVMTAASNSNFNYNGQSSTATFTGTVLVNGGLFQLSGASARLGGATAFTINGRGTFLLDNNDDSAPNDRIADTASFTVNSAAGAWGGTTIVRGLSIRSDNNGNESETIGALTFASGANYASLEASGGSSAFTAYIADTWVRQNGATLNIRGRALGATADAAGRTQFRIVDANDAALIAANIGGGGTIGGTAKNVSILPWAIGEALTGGVADTNMGNSFVSYVDNRGVVPLSLAGEYSTFATASAGHNVRESLTADLGSLASLTANSLIIHNNSTAASALTVSGAGAGALLGLGSGALMFTVNSAATASTAHAVTLGGFNDGISAASSGEYVIYVVNPSALATTPALTATIASPLTSAADLTKSGRGTLVLTAANTAGGGARRTTINEGVLQVGDLDGIGGNTGALVFAGGTLRLSAGFADDLSGRTISFLPGGGTLDTNGVDVALAGSLGSGAGGFTKLGAGNLTLNAAATFTGGVTVSGGTLTLGDDGALGVAGPLAVNAGATLDLGTRSLAVSSLTTSGASPAIIGTGTITSAQGFSFGHTGDITVAAVLAGAEGLSKSQSSVLTLTGANTYAGNTEVTAGTLVFDNIANVGAGASALGAPATAENGVIRMGFITNGAGLRYVGTGHATDRIIGLQGTTGTISLFASGTGALALPSGARFEMGGSKTLSLRGDSASGLENNIGTLTEAGGALTLNKTDANTWLLAAANAYTGATQVDNGTLKLGVSGALPATSALRLGTGVTAGVLDLNGFSQTVAGLTVQTNNNAVTNSILIAAGRTLTVNGTVTIGVNANESDTNFTATGGGSLVVNSNNGNFQVGAATVDSENRVDADLSGLGSFTANLGSGVFRLGDPSTGTGVGTSTLKLASASTITAATMRIGDGTGGSQVHALTLGNGANLFNVDTINIGSAGTAIRSSGSVAFDAADTTGSLTLRAANGTGRANLNLVNTSGNTAADISGVLDLAGHAADLLIGTLTMGARTTGNGAATGSLAFSQGTLDATSLLLVSRTGSGIGNGTGTLTIGGGFVDIDSVSMAVNTSAGGAVTASISITGGTVSLGGGAGTAVNMANAGTGRSVTSAITLTDGILSLAGNIVRAGGAGTENATVTLNGGVFDLNGFSLGESAKAITFTPQAGTLRDVGAINGTGGLTKTGAATLALEGDGSYVGATTVNEGKLTVTSLGDGIAPSALGQSSLTPANLVFATGVTFGYLGAGESSGRGFTVADSVTLESAGTGALAFSSAAKVAFSTTSASRTLTLTGAQTGANTFGAGLSVGGTADADKFDLIVKDGVGSWIFANGETLKSAARFDVNAGLLGLSGGVLPLAARVDLATGTTLRFETGNTDDLGSRIQLDAGAAVTLSVTSDVSFATALTVAGAGSAAVTKSGAGKLTLAADNTAIAGGFTVAQGTLDVTHALGLGAANATVNGGRLAVNAVIANTVNVANGGTLGGAGTLGAAVVASGGTLAPGNSPGAITIGNAMLAGGSVFDWQVQDATNHVTGYDKLNVIGNLDLTGASASNRIVFRITSLLGAGDGNTLGNPLNFAAAGGASSIRTFNLATVGNVLLNGGENISDVFRFDVTDFRYTDGSLSNAGLWSIDWNQANGAITLTAVPEPSTYGFGLGALALAAAAIRRRRRQAKPAA
jgi:autotransporter-associated beta strand protein